MRKIDADALLEQLSHAALSPASKMIVRMLVDDMPTVSDDAAEYGTDSPDSCTKASMKPRNK